MDSAGFQMRDILSKNNGLKFLNPTPCKTILEYLGYNM